MGGPTVGSGNTLRAWLMSQGWLWPLCGYSASLKISLHFAWYTVTTLLPLFTKSAVFCLQSYVHCANTTITCGFGCLWQGAKIIDVFNKKLKCYLHQCLISGNLPKTFIITFLLFSSSFFNWLSKIIWYFPTLTHLLVQPVQYCNQDHSYGHWPTLADAKDVIK